MTVNSQPISPSTTNTTSSIESIEDRETIHRNVKLIYTRNETEILYSRNFDFELNNLVSKIKFSEKVLLKNGITKSFIDSNYISWEILKEGAISGIITSRIEETDFDNWFLRMILEVSSNNFPEAIDENDHLTNAVSDLFVKTLKYSVDFDQWEFGGKAKFKETVKFFTSRMIPIEACLPAFPCKSSNLEKVSGKLPDKGEELALAGLVKFSQLVKIIYPPGFKLWIVSDGHVFSDCSMYNHILKVYSTNI